ncbi:MAG TPA: biotin synthase [Burkholderiaceae bacterium]
MAAKTESDARRLDAAAVAMVLRRLARAPQPVPWLHREIARRMAQRLEIIKLQPELVVDWWSQLGGGAEALRQAYPNARHVAVEPDAAWAQRAAAAAPVPRWWSPQRWRGDVPPPALTPDDELPAGAQLIWANMMLHAVVDPPRLFARWHGLLRVDGFVMFSCLGPGTLAELRTLYARLGWPAPTPGFVDMHDFGDMLVQAGFADPVMDQETLTLLYDSPEALLAELRSLGGNAAPDRFAGMRTPRWHARLLRELAALRNPDGKLALSFEVAYGHAFKAAPRLRPGEATTIALDDMKAMVRSRRDTRSEPGGGPKTVR